MSNRVYIELCDYIDLSVIIYWRVQALSYDRVIRLMDHVIRHGSIKWIGSHHFMESLILAQDECWRRA